jgi:hypothetical protein
MAGYLLVILILTHHHRLLLVNLNRMTGIINVLIYSTSRPSTWRNRWPIRSSPGSGTSRNTA